MAYIALGPCLCGKTLLLMQPQHMNSQGRFDSLLKCSDECDTWLEDVEIAGPIVEDIETQSVTDAGRFALDVAWLPSSVVFWAALYCSLCAGAS